MDNRESYYDVPKKIVMMSGEVENNKDEEAPKEPQVKKTVRQHLQENWQIGLKILELVSLIPI